MRARPDREVVRRLRAIDPQLSVRWVPNVERWGVYHNLPFNERFEHMIEANATALYTELWKRGYPVTKQVCEEFAFLQAQERHLVFYVCEDDGSYRPLDGRVIGKMQRMDYFRQNWGLKDWKEYMNAKARLQEELRERTVEDNYGYIHKDKVFKQYAADALRGDPHLRSVVVEQPDKPSRIPVEETRAERATLAGGDTCDSSV